MLPFLATLLFTFLPVVHADLDSAPEWDPGEYMASLTAQERWLVIQAAEQQVLAHTRSPEIARAVSQALALASRPSETIGNRVLSVSLENLAQLQRLTHDGGFTRARGLTPPRGVEIPRTAEAAIMDLRSISCMAPAGTGRAPVLAEVGLASGHRYIPTLTPCQIGQSTRLAEILTAWAADPARESETFGLLDLLTRQGHTVQVVRNHTFADFIALADERSVPARPIRMPLWVDTGIPLAHGRTLDFPVMHSEHIWLISGPRVNARVAFYLGTEGVGYFPKVYARPTWAGERFVARYSNQRPAERVTLKQVLRESAAYLRETRTAAAGLSRDGYGVVGICNDSTRTVAMALPGFSPSVVAWPLLTDLRASDRSDWTTRILASLPYALSDAARWDWADGLRDDLLELQAAH